MFGCVRLMLFLVFAFSLTFSPAVFAKNDNSHVDLPVLNFINALPKNAEPMYIQCGEGGIEHYANLKVGDKSQWKMKDNVTKSCEAFWGRQFAYWDVFQPQGGDSGHATVFWLVKDDGFFHSWDQSNWNKMYEWEHE